MRILITFFTIILFMGCSNSEKKEVTNNNDKILFIVSNQHFYGDTDMNAANHFGEIVSAYNVLVNESYNIDFVSPEGGAIPIG